VRTNRAASLGSKVACDIDELLADTILRLHWRIIESLIETRFVKGCRLIRGDQFRNLSRYVSVAEAAFYAQSAGLFDVSFSTGPDEAMWIDATDGTGPDLIHSGSWVEKGASAQLTGWSTG
jgi:hypothetical protein